MALMVLTSSLYLPSFNPETGLYEDICPIPARQRIEHRCMCNHKGTIFYTPTEFKSHIKLKKHQNYVRHYIDNIKELESSLAQNKKLQADYEIMYRKLMTEIRILKTKLNNIEVYHDA